MNLGNSRNIVSAASAIAAALIVIELLAPTNARAVTLSNLFTGQTITSNGYVFGNFTQTDLQIVNGGLEDPSQINVAPFIGDSINPGLVFTASQLGTPFGHSGLSSVTLSFSFSLTPVVAGPPRITSALEFIDGFIFDSGPNASIQLSKDMSGDGGSLGTLSAMAHGQDSLNPPSAELSDKKSFLAKNAMQLVDHIVITGPGTNDGVRLTSFQQRFFVSAPEPASWLLLGLGAVGIRMVTRRRKELI